MRSSTRVFSVGLSSSGLHALRRDILPIADLPTEGAQLLGATKVKPGRAAPREEEGEAWHAMTRHDVKFCIKCHVTPDSTISCYHVIVRAGPSEASKIDMGSA